VGLVYQNTGHGTQDRVPNVIPRTVYCLLYMGTRGPGLQMEARNTFPSLAMAKSELSAGVMCTLQCITITINIITL
jgi:hypothetical protein